MKIVSIVLVMLFLFSVFPTGARVLAHVQTNVFNAVMKQSPMGIVSGYNGPIAGAYVSAEGDNGSGYTITDSSGHYTMTTGLVTGLYNVTSFAVGYIRSQADFVNVTAGQTTTGINFELQASGEISGNVTDAVNGNPVNGTYIYADLSNGTGTFGWLGTTGTDGKYVLNTNLPTGMYNVSVILPPAGYIQSMTVVNVTAGFPTENVNLQLAWSGILSGKVAAPNGTGLSGISVFAYSSNSTYYGFATTNSSGNYRIASGLATANYTVFASGDGNYTFYGGISPISVPVTAGQETSGINIVLTPALPTSGTIAGRLTDQSSSPIVGASVIATGTNGSGSGSTDSNGYYNITGGLGTGDDYNVSATASGYYNAYYPTLVHVTVGQTTSNINIQMTAQPPQNYGTITGTITTYGYSSTLVVCSPDTTSAGSIVTCTATVSGSNPTGNVTWTTSSDTGSFLWTGNSSQPVITLSSGTCSINYTDTSTGYTTITANYSGDSNNLPSSGNTTLTVFVNLTTGTNVTVNPTSNLELTFANVTAAGIVVANETPTVPAPPPDLVGEYYVINVTASFSGNVTVIVAFDGSNMTQQQKGNLTMIQYTPIVGDVVAPFGRVDMRDVAYMARHFGTNPTSPNWDPAADLNGDGVVNMKDIAIVARHFGFTANWIGITTYVDTVNNIIYGSTTHFSFIGIHN